jgi:hypothetical protein
MSEKINQEENKVNPSPPQPSPDVNARSQSVAFPAAKSSPLRLSHAHFDIPNIRSELNTDPERAKSMGNIPGVAGSSRPKTSRTTSFAASMKKRQSMVRNMSSYSLYSNFAGEHLDDDYLPSRRSSMASAAARRRSLASHRSSGKYDEKIIGEEHLEEDVEDEVPTASVGKAMFMFLKAFIGSGVLFLPKA